MAGDAGDDSLYPIAVLIDELRNEDVQVSDDDNDPNGHSLVMIIMWIMMMTTCSCGLTPSRSCPPSHWLWVWRELAPS